MGLGEYEGKHYGLPTNVNSKSLVWYHIPTLETNGIAIPTTWEELKAASQTLLDAGVTPWCIGTGSDAATGWPATDWMEDIMLRTAGVDLYDQWVAHEIPFNHESVLRAANLFDEILAADGWVLGGRENVPDIDFRDAPDPMADGTCAFHRQASFIVSFFPEGTVIGEDVGVFAFPDIDEGKKGALIAGELAAIFADRPEVRAFLENFTSVEVQCAMGNFEGIGRISPHTGTSGECYLEPVLATASDSIVAALIGGGARFDASDLMPSSVGSGSFWTGMNEWMRGKAIEDVLAEIEASWP
jgi:alpha-glucoside transport system substrate-binding protein